MAENRYVVVGAPIYRDGAYIIDKFLENQKRIQENYPSSELVLATIEKDFVEELEEMLSRWGVKARTILYETVKPEYAASIAWNTSCGREAIRKYALEIGASYLLFTDADMVCDPQIIDILSREIKDYDMVASGYMGKNRFAVTIGTGCILLTQGALRKTKFRCYEFKNHQTLDEGETLEMDSFSKRLRFKKGYFLTIDHYNRDGSFGHIEPHAVSLSRKITNSLFIRYILMKASIVLRYNISSALYRHVRPRNSK
jgi:hypothetical protein